MIFKIPHSLYLVHSLDLVINSSIILICLSLTSVNINELKYIRHSISRFDLNTKCLFKEKCFIGKEKKTLYSNVSMKSFLYNLNYSPPEYPSFITLILLKLGLKTNNLTSDELLGVSSSTP